MDVIVLRAQEHSAVVQTFDIYSSQSIQMHFSIAYNDKDPHQLMFFYCRWMYMLQD